MLTTPILVPYSEPVWTGVGSNPVRLAAVQTGPNPRSLVFASATRKKHNKSMRAPTLAAFPMRKTRSLLRSRRPSPSFSSPSPLLLHHHAQMLRLPLLSRGPRFREPWGWFLLDLLSQSSGLFIVSHLIDFIIADVDFDDYDVLLSCFVWIWWCFLFWLGSWFEIGI